MPDDEPVDKINESDDVLPSLNKAELLLLDKHLKNFSFFRGLSDGDDPYLFLNGLLWELFRRDVLGGELVIGEACQLIPTRHYKTSRKYLDIAISDGFVELKKHKHDKRIVLVKPTTKLRNKVKRELEQAKRSFEEFMHAYSSVNDGELVAKEDRLSITI